ncbi:response regulator [bacterium]|nr:MAG: response regulator [bacterium]
MFRKTYENPAYRQIAMVADAVPIPRQPDLEGARILVADDERDARQMIAMALQNCGATVYAASSADEAVNLAMKHEFDVLVTDLAMPGGDGFSLLRALRLRTKRMPAIALSAMRGQEVEKDVHDAGFALHVDKPIELTYLTAAVADVIWNAKEKKYTKVEDEDASHLFKEKFLKNLREKD